MVDDLAIHHVVARILSAVGFEGSQQRGRAVAVAIKASLAVIKWSFQGGNEGYAPMRPIAVWANCFSESQLM